MAVRPFLLLLVFLGAAQLVRASSVDSLRQQLAGARTDTARVLLLEQLCWQLNRRDATAATWYGQQGLTLARRPGFGRGEAECLNALAAAALWQQDYVAASRYYQHVLRLTRQQSWAPAAAGRAWLGLGRIAAQEQEFARADRYFRLALGVMHQYAASASEQATGWNDLAMLYAGWLRSGLPAPDSVARLGTRYARQALAAGQQSGVPLPIRSTALNVMAIVHQSAGRYDSAVRCHQQALRLHERSGDRFSVAQTQLSLGEIYGLQRRWAQALPLLRQGVAEAHRLRAAGVEAEGYELLAAAEAATGNGMAAYQYAQRQLQLLDSLNSAKRREALARLQVQFDTERQRNRVRALSQQARLQALAARKQHQYLLLTVVVLVVTAAGLLASGVLAWRLRRSRAQLARQNEELTTTRAEQDRLYALIAHDLRSPVVAFSGLADLLTRYIERQDMARLAGLGGRVRQAAEGLRALLDTLLHWALSQRGELTPVLETVSVAALLTEAAALYQPGAEAAGVQLLVEPADAYLTADANMTRTILRNLLSNALRATPPGGDITLSAAAEASAVELRVTDTGEGIEPEQLQQLLGSHNPARRLGAQSTGLGLRLSFIFARIQHGQLTLTSTLGQGTTATLRLPAAPAPGSANPTTDAAIPTTDATAAGWR
jgi:signal transduction histidine kinase